MTPRIVLLVIALLVVVPCASQAAPVSGRTPAAARARVSARDSLAMRLKVRTLADPRWEGRGLGTAGIDSASHWIAGRLAAAGFAPAGDDGGWFQSFEVTTGVVAEAPCVLQVGERRFELGDALQPLGFSNNGTARTRVVFAGYGITAPGYQLSLIHI